MNPQDTINAVMAQARDECLSARPENPTESELSAMYTRRALIICEHRQGALEATQAKLVEIVGREQLWSYKTPHKPGGYDNAEHLVRETFDEIGGSRSRRCLMRGVAKVAGFGEENEIDTREAIQHWGNFRDVLPEMKRACDSHDKARLSSVLTDVVKLSRDKLRDKYKDSDKPKAGAGRFFFVDGQQYFLARVTDGERAAPTLGKLFDNSDDNDLGVIATAEGDQIKVVTFRPEPLDDLWAGIVEDELEEIPI